MFGNFKLLLAFLVCHAIETGLVLIAHSTWVPYPQFKNCILALRDYEKLGEKFVQKTTWIPALGLPQVSEQFGAQNCLAIFFHLHNAKPNVTCSIAEAHDVTFL